MGRDKRHPLGNAGIAYRYTDEITLLAKDTYSRIDYNDGDRTINRFQLGAAYRDYDSNQLDMLAKLEYRLDDNNTGDDTYQKTPLFGHGMVTTIQRVP